jgi:integrase
MTPAIKAGESWRHRRSGNGVGGTLGRPGPSARPVVDHGCHRGRLAFDHGIGAPRRAGILDPGTRFEEALKEIKRQKIASSRIDRDSVSTKGEVKALIKGIRGSKLRLVVKFLATTGLRIFELIGIRLEDVKATDSHYLVRVLGKGQKQRAVKVSQDLTERVRKTHHGRGYLFESSGGKPLGRESVSREITRAGRRILGKHISAHSLRHAFATAAIKAGWSAKKVAAQLGHSSTAITLDMYVQDAPSWQDVAELWGDLPSREAEGQHSTDR